MIVRSLPGFVRSLIVRGCSAFGSVAAGIDTGRTPGQGPSVYARGSGVLGALGLGDSLHDADTYKKVFLQQSTTVPVASVSAGWGHSACVTTDGRLYVWGRPYDFSNILQINRIQAVSPGLGRFVGRFTNWFGTGDSDDGLYTKPMMVRVPGMENVLSVVCSAGLTVALTADGDLYAFGLNRWGQCGVEQTETLVNGKRNKYGIHCFEPTRVPLMGAVKAFDVGLQHCIALVDGQALTWGKGTRGQLGDGNNDTSTTAVKPKLPEGTAEAIAVSAGFAHTALLTADGQVYLWGKGMSTVSKDGGGKVETYEDEIRPRLVLPLPDDRRAVDIVSSNFTLAVCDEEGGLWALGVGEYDRNTTPHFLRVQQAIDPADADTGPNASSAPVKLPTGTRLKKGYQRVIVLPPTESTSGGDRSSVTGLAEYDASALAFELVLHQSEAFLQEAQELSTDGRAALVDYSSGWQHTLAIFEK